MIRVLREFLVQQMPMDETEQARSANFAAQDSLEASFTVLAADLVNHARVWFTIIVTVLALFVDTDILCTFTFLDQLGRVVLVCLKRKCVFVCRVVCRVRRSIRESAFAFNTIVVIER